MAFADGAAREKPSRLKPTGFRKREAKFVKTGKEPEEIQIAETVWGLTWTYHVGSRWSDVFRVEVVPTSGGCKAMYSVYRMTGE